MSPAPKFKAAAKRYKAALVDMLAEDYVTALPIITGDFVSIVLEVCRRNGHDTNTNIVVNGGDKRDITIHKSKAISDQVLTDRITALEAQNAELRRAALALTVALDAFACASDPGGWAGCENGDGVDVGTALDVAIDGMKRAVGSAS